jgi:hypothetical protein
VLTAVLVAIASAIGFSIANPVQHRSAGAAPEGSRGAVSLMLHLLRRPAWVVGTSLGIVSLVLHGIAVHLGALAVVQPIATSGMVFAVLGRPLLDRTAPTRREIGGALVTAVGLTTFIIASHPHTRAKGNESVTALVFMGLAVAVAAVLAYAAGRQRSDNGRGLLIGCATGVLFGALAGVLKLTAGSIADGGLVGAITHWPLYVLVAVGVGGVILNQHAYQRSPLSVTMPVLNVVDVLVAVGFGYAVFGEVPSHGPLAVIAEVIALLLMAAGVRQLTRSQASTFFSPEISPRP